MSTLRQRLKLAELEVQEANAFSDGCCGGDGKDLLFSTLDINLSQRCNLSCPFCYAPKSESPPDLPAIRKGLDWFSQRTKGRVNVFGGEPLLEWGTLTSLVESYPSLHFRIVSNLTLLDRSKLDWLDSHRVGVGASIDGCLEAQEISRPGCDPLRAFEAAVLLLSSRPQSSARMTVIPSALPYFCKSIRFLAELGFRTINPVLASGVEWTDDQLFYLECELREIASLHLPISLYQIRNVEACLKRGRGLGLCGAGLSRLSVDDEGRLQPCHRFIGYKKLYLGSISGKSAGGKWARLRSNLRVRCPGCEIERYCYAHCWWELALSDRIETTEEGELIITPSPQYCRIWQTYFRAIAPPSHHRPRKTVSTIITSRNEGGEVIKTVESLHDSVKDYKTEIVLVDDGSTDGSCDFAASLPYVNLVRHKSSEGVGLSRNAGYSVSQGDFITYHDAHMRFSRSAISHLLQRAGEGLVITSGSSRSMGGSFSGAGCDLYYGGADGLKAKWILQKFHGWKRVPCIMGAAYALSRETAEKLRTATGQLWEDIWGRWGFSEQALSLKAFLLGIPCLVSGDDHFSHLFRSKNPVPDPAHETRANIVGCLSRIFHPLVFQERFAYTNQGLSPEEFWWITSCNEQQPRPWSIPDERRAFLYLCGKGATVSSIHPDFEWLAEIEKELKSKAPSRILSWRAGEAVLLAHRLLPSSEIAVVETAGHRKHIWKSALDHAKIGASYLAPESADYVTIPEGSWQMALVGGERQMDCVSNAEKAGIPTILVHPSADRDQITDREKNKEETRVITPKADVTVLLLNWKRPKNFAPLLDSLEKQTAKLKIYLWNNGDPISDPRISLNVSSSDNVYCWPRWCLASLADTDYVMSLDDDLILSDSSAVEKMIAATEVNKNGIIGLFGWSHSDGASYLRSHHLSVRKEIQRADCIKGRVMLMRREVLQQVPLIHPAMRKMPQERGTNDDIYLSLCVSKCRAGFHVIPAFEKKPYQELPSQNALSHREGWYNQREEAIRRFLLFYGGWR